MLKFLESELINPDVGFHFSDYCSIKNTRGLHEHDFYEFFITYGGSVLHQVNGVKELLQEGTLVFIRPRDRHSYEELHHTDCYIMNVAFPARLMEDLFRFLGPSPFLERLINSAAPPQIVLPVSESLILKKRFHRLAWSAAYRTGSSDVPSLFKALITEVLFRQFSKQQKPELVLPDIPVWLTELQMTMKRKENFIEGLPALHSYCDKSPEYISRSIKRHLGVTPTEWINGFRLQYASKLLRSTDAEVIEVAMDSGFDNLSYFYRLFKSKFGQTPVQYRKSFKNLILPE
ncbi:helix-turn-helix domain-containing protein [Paenibacillus swuensis]|uniref:helix-turn-helix domain-containing protein n=1 Tax=Paenibacillus swuensis TaxID=1178515 RepID=UPI0018D4A116|nr:helix-turn-helix domain-containing protein [Paenibacillus swuensis]